MNVFKKIRTVYSIFKDFETLNKIRIALKNIEVPFEDIQYFIEDKAIEKVTLDGETYEGSEKAFLEKISFQESEIKELKNEIKELKSKLFVRDFGNGLKNIKSNKEMNA
jgi:DNA-binding transcriptional MerR regulator